MTVLYLFVFISKAPYLAYVLALLFVFLRLCKICVYIKKGNRYLVLSLPCGTLLFLFSLWQLTTYYNNAYLKIQSIYLFFFSVWRDVCVCVFVCVIFAILIRLFFASILRRPKLQLRLFHKTKQRNIQVRCVFFIHGVETSQNYR